MQPRLCLIAAVCDNRGIGIKGDLPWKLKNEMAYFTKMTSSTKDKEKRNAVIMGRLTWMSIPPKYKPLQGRLNVIISKTMKETKHDAVIFENLTTAVNNLAQSPYVNDIETSWIIGGASVYKEAIDSNLCHRIYLTKIDKSFECDTFFPEIPPTFIEVTDDAVPKGIQEEGSITYEFKVYENKNQV